jgi:hypothetical protein
VQSVASLQLMPVISAPLPVAPKTMGLAHVPAVSTASMGWSFPLCPAAVQDVGAEQLIAKNVPLPFGAITKVGDPHAPDVSVT